MQTSIRLNKETKKQLEELKIIPRETLDSVILRLINNDKV